MKSQIPGRGYIWMPGIINPNTSKGQLIPDRATLDPRGGMCCEQVGKKFAGAKDQITE